MSAHVERTIAGLARGQHGIVARSQLLDAGLAGTTIDARRQAGLLLPMAARTYRVASAAPTREGRILAACLACTGVASHWSAAWLHGLVTAAELDHRRMIDVTVLKGRSVAPLGSIGPGGWWARRRGTTSLPACDITSVRGIPVTSVARTVLGLAAQVPVELSQAELVELVSQAAELGLASERWMAWLLEHRRCRGRNGVRAFEAALAERSRLGPTESWLERESLRVLEAGGVPLPTVQRVVRRADGIAARVDFSYEPEGIVMEALGYAFHRTRAQADADAQRANELQLVGKQVLQFTAQRILEDPASVVRTVQVALDTAHHRSVIAA